VGAPLDGHVRYGEDDYNVGGGRDRTEKYPFAYLYRDWLIGALNDDMSYEIVRQDAAGGRSHSGRKDRDKNIAAPGMNGNGMWELHASPAPVERADEWHDKVDVTSKAFMGLTVGCARCHDHKFDAIYTKDYYSMASIFASSRFKDYARVPKAIADEWEKQNKVLEKKNKDLSEFLGSRVGSLRADAVCADRALHDGGPGRSRPARRRRSRASPTRPSSIRSCSAVGSSSSRRSQTTTRVEAVAGDDREEGQRDEAKKLAKEFFDKLADVNEKQIKLQKENDVILAQYKNPDDFYDPDAERQKATAQCLQIDLKSLEREDNQLWRDVFETDVPEATAEVDPRSAASSARPVEADRRCARTPAHRRPQVDTSTATRADIDAFKKAMPPRPPSVYGIEDLKDPADLKVFVRGNPYAFGVDAPRALPSF
jgi:hypothetical protein